jgi:hypothetical protein
MADSFVELCSSIIAWMLHALLPALLLLAAEFTAPALPRVEYPPPEVQPDLRHRLDARLTLTMEVAADGLVTKVAFESQENLPEGAVDGTVAFFRGQLEGKRARPAERDGRPIACTYRHIFVWPLAYPPPQEFRYPDDLPRNGQYSEDLPDLPRTRIRLDTAPPVPLVSTPDGRQVTVEAFLDELDAKARALMDPAAFHTVREGPLTVATDETDGAMVELCLAVLKAVPVEFARVFRPLLPEAPAVPGFRVYLFRRPQDFLEFQGALGVPRWADGAYLGTLRLLSASTGQGHPWRTREVLIHEQVHALVREILLPRASAPVWLNEGLAEVFAGSRIDEKGRMLFGTVERKEAVDRRTGKTWTGRSRLHQIYLWEKQSALKGRLIPSLLYDRWAPAEDLNEREIQRFYASSWALTLLLLGDDPAVPDPAFLDFVRDLRAGFQAPQAFTARFGPWDAVDQRLWKAVRRW